MAQASALPFSIIPLLPVWFDHATPGLAHSTVPLLSSHDRDIQVDLAGTRATHKRTNPSYPMITRLLSPSTASALFSAERLPEVVHSLVLRNLTAPIVHSDSMTPTIQKGDILELHALTDLKVDDVVVYRRDHLFICHRIHEVKGPRLFLRGDAATGPDEEIDAQLVIGRVDFISRGGKRLAVGLRSSSRVTPSDPTGEKDWRGSLPRARAFALRLVNRAADLPGIKTLVRTILRRHMRIAILERVSLQCLDGYVLRHHVRLDQLQHVWSDPLRVTPVGILFMIHVGPVSVGVCNPNPWQLHMRPLLRPLTTGLFLESVESFLATTPPPHLIQPQ